MGKSGIAVYEPHYRVKKNIFSIWINIARTVIGSRYLVLQLFKRDFLFVYKRSFLSIGWFFISPLLGIISWVFMNATQIINPGNVGMPYPAYILINTSLWGLFMGFYQSASDALYGGLPFILDIKCPHEILLAKQTAQQLAGFFMGFIVNIVVLLACKITLSWTIVLFPLVIVPLFFLGAGIGLLASIFRVVMPDLKRWLDFIMQLLMFFTPVIYSESVDNTTLRGMILYNPMTYLIGGARDIMVNGHIEHVQPFVYASILSLLVFLFMTRAFYLSEDRIIERMF